jgi:hypothetical protein
MIFWLLAAAFGVMLGSHVAECKWPSKNHDAVFGSSKLDSESSSSYSGTDFRPIMTWPQDFNCGEQRDLEKPISILDPIIEHINTQRILDRIIKEARIRIQPPLPISSSLTFQRAAEDEEDPLERAMRRTTRIELEKKHALLTGFGYGIDPIAKLELLKEDRFRELY